jgi:hypothetical protein
LLIVRITGESFLNTRELNSLIKEQLYVEVRVLIRELDEAFAVRIREGIVDMSECIGDYIARF